MLLWRHIHRKGNKYLCCVNRVFIWKRKSATLKRAALHQTDDRQNDI